MRGQQHQTGTGGKVRERKRDWGIMRTRAIGSKIKQHKDIMTTNTTAPRKQEAQQWILIVLAPIEGVERINVIIVCPTQQVEFVPHSLYISQTQTGKIEIFIVVEGLTTQCETVEDKLWAKEEGLNMRITRIMDRTN